MLLVSCSVTEDPERYLNTFRKDDFKCSQLVVADTHLCRGDYVVVSQDGGTIALATGIKLMFV